jgi:hypothetical protein
MKLALKLPARFNPRKPRAAVVIEATLLLPNDCATPISIMNISTDGFMGETEAEVSAGARIGVALPGCGIVPARVCWNTAGELGAQFSNRLDLDRLHEHSLDDDEKSLFPSRILQGPL